ncbi:MAG: TIGR02266 family protein [Deltaproteobacteria bacterium]|nr:TIGR02266 family protein [Deltaproteobacteria bacterium]
MTEPNQEKDERRRYPRAPVSLLIQYRFDTLDDFLAEYSTDISMGGMFIRTDDIREEGSLVYLQFYLRDGAKLIEGLGRVVRVVHPEEAESPNSFPGMGIEFVNFDDESMQLVEQIVDRNLASKD